MVVCSASDGRKALMYLTSPKNCLTCFTVVGASQFSMWNTLDKSASIPQAEMWCLKKLILVENSIDLFDEQ